MRHSRNRCIHCRDYYLYQMSGSGAPDYNNDRYCPECYKAISDTLKTIPKKYEKKWVRVNDVSLEQLEKWYAEDKSMIRQVAFPLFRMEKGVAVESQTARIVIDPINKHKYQYRYWKGLECEAEITVECELNKKTDTVTKIVYHDYEPNRQIKIGN